MRNKIKDKLNTIIFVISLISIGSIAVTLVGAHNESKIEESDLFEYRAAIATDMTVGDPNILFLHDEDTIQIDDENNNNGLSSNVGVVLSFLFGTCDGHTCTGTCYQSCDGTCFWYQGATCDHRPGSTTCQGTCYMLTNQCHTCSFTCDPPRQTCSGGISCDNSQTCYQNQNCPPNTAGWEQTCLQFPGCD